MPAQLFRVPCASRAGKCVYWNFSPFSKATHIYGNWFRNCSLRFLVKQGEEKSQSTHGMWLTIDGEEVVYLNSGIFCLKNPLNYSETLCLPCGVIWSLLHF